MVGPPVEEEEEVVVVVVVAVKRRRTRTRRMVQGMENGGNWLTSRPRRDLFRLLVLRLTTRKSPRTPTKMMTTKSQHQLLQFKR
jgi:hypothetical protein